MYLLFLDESGTPPKPAKAAGKYLAIGGVIVPEGVWHGIASEFRTLARKARVHGEVKWKYFGLGNNDPKNNLTHLNQDKRNAFRSSLLKVLTSRKAIKIICCVTCIEAAYARPTIDTQDDVYHLTYKGVTERFQYFLQDASRIVGQPQFGLVVSDHRMASDDTKLRARHHQLVDTPETFTSTYKNFIETIFFTPSESAVGLQLADLAAGAVHRSFQYGEHRFADELRPAFRASPQGRILGYGVVKMPKATFINPPRGNFLER